MAAVNPFSPISLGTVTLTVGASSTRVALVKGGQPLQVMVQSLAANAIAYIEFGGSTVAATIPAGAVGGGTPILPGTISMFTVGADSTNIACIGTAGTLYVTTGYGV